MIRPLYDWVLRIGTHKYALWGLAFISFIESSVFPIPPDVVMIPMVLAAPERAWVIACVCTVASVLGGLLGYYIGAVLFTFIGQPILELYGYEGQFEKLADSYNEQGALAVLIAGVTPFPFKVITIFSGVSGLDLATFIATSIVARSIRFFVVAGLLWKYGQPIRSFVEKRLGLMFTLFCVLLVGGFVAVKWLH